MLQRGMRAWLRALLLRAGGVLALVRMRGFGSHLNGAVPAVRIVGVKVLHLQLLSLWLHLLGGRNGRRLGLGSGRGPGGRGTLMRPYSRLAVFSAF